jgi:hypothetical protein
MVDIFREITGPLYPVLDWPMNTGPNGGYNVCSGIAGLSFFGILWHRHNCHTDGCWRPVRHGRALCKRCERRAITPIGT